MRRILSFFILLNVLTISVSFADQGSAHKLYRGVVNIITAPIEVPKQARAYWIKGAQLTPHILVWIGCGAVWGVVQGIKRAGSGAWDIVSFPLNKPSNYDPLLKPEYVFDEWPKNPKSGR